MRGTHIAVSTLEQKADFVFTLQMYNALCGVVKSADRKH